MSLNIDELKLVLETVKSISGDAGSVAYWWLILGFTVDVLRMLIIGGIFTLALFLGWRALGPITWAQREIKYVAARLGVSDYDAWFSSDRSRLHDALDRALRNSEPKA